MSQSLSRKLEGINRVYVDEPFSWPLEEIPKKAQRHGYRWCHLWTDPGNEEALHRLARIIGLKPQWFQNRPGFPHYDIVPAKRLRAIAAGAIEKSLMDWVKERGIA